MGMTGLMVLARLLGEDQAQQSSPHGDQDSDPYDENQR
jgi:hypothetical protein